MRDLYAAGDSGELYQGSIFRRARACHHPRRMSKEKPVIAVLDDEPQMRKALRRLLTSHGLEVRDYSKAEDLMAALAAHPADCLVLDLHMPLLDGVSACARLRRDHPSLCLLALTGDEAPALHRAARESGADDVLLKSQLVDGLLERLTAARVTA